MYGIEPIFWLKLIFLIVILSLLFIVFGSVMRRWLKVEKKKFFSHNHVNEKHKKMDWTIRIVFIAFIILGSFINATLDFSERIWFLEPWYLLFGLTILSETVRALMEWKYADNKNSYIFTLSQLVFGMILVISILTTNFWGIV
ncbi:DUF4181 domain-containing protein [Psychrobacillus sp. AK 1817]|uniref:DUF4181 domain-containing protein n=1 Tax=Psychrobacillus sp. AK 1817 TaxID=2303505 RepID=UPI001243DDE2|nr:DUF4181 domain-containing protein [Psychrobacillus sp. AK 1817]QEY20776.1 DUF4181 domain-containing protein [Psychrobacillus sp. AK 1817]